MISFVFQMALEMCLPVRGSLSQWGITKQFLGGKGVSLACWRGWFGLLRNRGLVKLMY